MPKMNLGYSTEIIDNSGGSCGCGKKGGPVCDLRTVKSVSRVGDKLIVAFDDCTYTPIPFEVVDMASIMSATMPTSEKEFGARLVEAESKVKKLYDALTTINTFGDKDAFVAFDSSIKPNKE